MKVILTTQKEKSNIKQITDLINLMLFDYNVKVIEKKKIEKKKSTKEVKKEPLKNDIERQKEFSIRNAEKRKIEKEWLEDYYYSQNKDREEIDKLIDYYSNRNKISNHY